MALLTRSILTPPQQGALEFNSSEIRCVRYDGRIQLSNFSSEHFYEKSESSSILCIFTINSLDVCTSLTMTIAKSRLFKLIVTHVCLHDLPYHCFFFKARSIWRLWKLRSDRLVNQSKEIFVFLVLIGRPNDSKLSQRQTNRKIKNIFICKKKNLLSLLTARISDLKTNKKSRFIY